MKTYLHISPTVHPDTGEWGLQAFNDSDDRIFILCAPDRALQLIPDLADHAHRHMVPA